MDTDETEPKESALSPGATPPPGKLKLTLEKAIDFGEYDPEYLAQFQEWHAYTRHMQFELIKKALLNRRRQLLNQWMELNCANDYRIKPHLQEASSSIDRQLEKLTKDKEMLYSRYSMEE